MTKTTDRYQIVVRSIYIMTAILIAMAVVAFSALYIIHSADRSARERVTLYHTQSSALAQQLHRSYQSVLQKLGFVSTQVELSLPGVSQPGPDVQATLRMMSEQVAQLHQLQQTYNGDEFVPTLERLTRRLATVAREVTGASQPNSAAVRAALANLDLSIEQLYRQHNIAAYDTLESIDETANRVLPSFGVIGVLLAMIALIAWITARQLKHVLRRQVDIETELAENREQMHHMQKLDALGQLVGGIAHDFNNLLTAIVGHAGLLLDKTDTDKNLRFGLEQIQKAGQQAASLTRQLLTFSRPEALESRVFDLNTLIHDMEDLLRRLIGESVELVVQSADTLDPVEMDPGQLRQVVLNLAVNARDAMPDGGQLTVVTQNVTLTKDEASVHRLQAGRYVKMIVLDTGTGMDEETRVRIFDPYFTTKPKDRGTGLGLSTVHGIVTSARGHITAYSRPGAGARFEILLPASEKELDSGSKKQVDAERLRGTETVLVVEDEQQIRSFLNEGLTSLGYQVLLASDADAALRACRYEEDPIDVIVCDVVLPHTNGVRFLDEAMQLRPTAVGVFISGYTDDVLSQSGVASGKVPLVYKPFELHALAALIRRQLD